MSISALHGPGFGSKPGPSRSPRAGPLHNFAGRAGPGRAGPGRAWAYILRARAGPGLKKIKHIGLGPGLGLVLAGRAGLVLGLDIIKIFIQNPDYEFYY